MGTAKTQALSITHEPRESASGGLHGRSASVESGTVEDVSVSMVIGFAKAFQWSAAYLLGRDDPEQARSNG